MRLLHWRAGWRARLEARARAYRRRRFTLFLRLVDKVLVQRDTCRILDLGGAPGYWSTVDDIIGERNIHVTMVNLTPYAVEDRRFAPLVADARNLSVLADNSFDLVHSNSVIEHVGRWQDMRAMAHEVRRLAPSYYVQTPYFWFPIEPHYAIAFFHWMPAPVRAGMLMRRPRWHWDQTRDLGAAMQEIEGISLLDHRMLVTLFPDAAIHRERFAGLTKSLIAVRDRS